MRASTCRRSSRPTPTSPRCSTGCTKRRRKPGLVSASAGRNHRAAATLDRRRPQGHAAEGAAGHDLGRRLSQRRIPRARLSRGRAEAARMESAQYGFVRLFLRFGAGAETVFRLQRSRRPDAAVLRLLRHRNRRQARVAIPIGASRPTSTLPRTKSCSFPTSSKNSMPHALPACTRPCLRARRRFARAMARMRASPIFPVSNSADSSS